MARKEFYIGNNGPMLYDDEVASVDADKRLITKGDVVELIEDISDELENLVGVGLIVKDANGDLQIRELAAGTNITITYPDGASGNPVIALSGNIETGIVSCSNLQIRQSAVAVGPSPNATHTVPVDINGVSYLLLLKQP